MNLDIRELKVENREVQQDVRELKAENKELKQQNLLQEQTIKELKANFMAFKQRLDPLEEESKVIQKRGNLGKIENFQFFPSLLGPGYGLDELPW